MKSDTYIFIYRFMLDELKLQGNELLAYAIIYGFGEYYGGAKYLAEALGMTVCSAHRLLRNMVGKNFLKKEGKAYVAIVPTDNKIVSTDNKIVPTDNLYNKYSISNTISNTKRQPIFDSRCYATEEAMQEALQKLERKLKA